MHLLDLRPCISAESTMLQLAESNPPLPGEQRLTGVCCPASPSLLLLLKTAARTTQGVNAGEVRSLADGKGTARTQRHATEGRLRQQQAVSPCPRRDGAGGQQELRCPFVCCSAPGKRVLLGRFPSPPCRPAAKLLPQDGRRTRLDG